VGVAQRPLSTRDHVVQHKRIQIGPSVRRKSYSMTWIGKEIALARLELAVLVVVISTPPVKSSRVA